MLEGQDKPCYYCKELCDSLIGNPGRWPVALCHPDEPGKVKWHHEQCVSDRLIRLEKLEENICKLCICTVDHERGCECCYDW